MKQLLDLADRVMSMREQALSLTANRAQVGLFDGGGVRPDGLANVAVGRKHEFGELSSRGKPLPTRSFLRAPFEEHADKMDLGALRPAVVACLDGAPADAVLNTFGYAGAALVDAAFATEGFGAWPSLAPETVEAKGNADILQDSGQLRAAITYRLEK